MKRFPKILCILLSFVFLFIGIFSSMVFAEQYDGGSSAQIKNPVMIVPQGQDGEIDQELPGISIPAGPDSSTGIGNGENVVPQTEEASNVGLSEDDNKNIIPSINTEDIYNIKSMRELAKEIRKKYKEMITEKKNKLNAIRENKKDDAKTEDEINAEAELQKLENDIQAEQRQLYDQAREQFNEIRELWYDDTDLSVETFEESRVEIDVRNEVANISVTDGSYGDNTQKRIDILGKMIASFEAIENPSKEDLQKLAAAYTRVGEFEKALSILDGLLEVEPESHTLLIQKVNTYRAMKKFTEAIEIAKHLVKKHVHIRTRLLLALITHEIGEYDETAKILETVIMDSERNPRYYKWIGEVYQAMGYGGFKVFVKGERPKFDVEPVAHDGRLLVPLRAIVEALGAEVEYRQEDNSITVKKDDITIFMVIGQNKASVNGNEITLDVPALVINERTLVPVRFLSENLNTEVTYDDASKIVIINEKQVAQ